MKAFIESNKEQLYALIKELCAIPAPSHFEKERAEFCKNWLESNGAKGVYIDNVLNVILPINCESSNKITVFAAHTDTVFPDKEPMPYFDDGVTITSPGVGDDTASLAILLLCAKYFIENKIFAKDGIMFVCNSCEEGLGNLKGTKQLFKDYEDRIAQFITFDANLTNANDRCVGSHRYEVEVVTNGGHSYTAFGNKNAIAELSKIINKIYSIDVPKIDNSKTTYNVGDISGGTSINTIAQSAKMLCEYRSDNEECLLIMKKNFEEIFASALDGVDIKVKLIGDRPCMRKVDLSKIAQLTDIYRKIIKDTIQKDITCLPGSTDCNVPLSLSVPALCIGVYNGGGSHTRQEWVDKASLTVGLEVAIKMILEVIENT